MKKSMVLVGVTFGAMASFAGAWQKCDAEAVYGNMGTGFLNEPTVIAEGDDYTMYFTASAENAIQCVTSKDGKNWTKNPRMCLVADSACGWEGCVCGSTIVKKDGVWHMWYTGLSGMPKVGLIGKIGYATSKDGVRFTRVTKDPVLVGDKDLERDSVKSPCVRWDAARKVWRMWYTAGWVNYNSQNAKICYAESNDGVKWTKSEKNPVFVGDAKSWNNGQVTGCDVIKLGDKWAMFYTGWNTAHTGLIGCAVSDDGISGWKSCCKKPVIEPTADTWDASACCNPTVLRDEKNKRLVMWYAGIQGDPERIGYAVHNGLDL